MKLMMLKVALLASLGLACAVETDPQEDLTSVKAEGADEEEEDDTPTCSGGNGYSCNGNGYNAGSVRVNCGGSTPKCCSNECGAWCCADTL